jgi:predicted metal-dependent TIM-barrel fold hydrolase
MKKQIKKNDRVEVILNGEIEFGTVLHTPRKNDKKISIRVDDDGLESRSFSPEEIKVIGHIKKAKKSSTSKGYVHFD